MNDFIGAVEAQLPSAPAFEGPLSSANPGYAPRAQPPRELPFAFDHEVFVLFRPWENCARCRAQLEREGEALAIELEGDRVCPHTRRSAYLALRARMLKDGLRQVSCREETLKNGVIQISVSWVTPEQKEEVRRTLPRL